MGWRYSQFLHENVRPNYSVARLTTWFNIKVTGIIKGFKLEVSEATNVVSKLTMIDQNAAVSAGNIATAMQQVSASAQQAGLDINTTMGYISTIADVSQRDPSSVGASLI